MKYFNKSGLYIVIFIFLIYGNNACKKKENPFAAVAGKWTCDLYHEKWYYPAGFYKEFKMVGNKFRYINYYYYNASIQPRDTIIKDFKYDIQTFIDGNKFTMFETYILTDSNGVEEKIPYHWEFDLVEGQATYGSLTFDTHGEHIGIDNHTTPGSSGGYFMKRQLTRIK